MPRFATGYGLSILNGMGIMLISVHGLNLLTGYTGQISLGQAGFMAVGAYSSALLVDRAGVPFLLALPLSGLIAGLVGLLFGLPSVRIKGFYLAMATLAAQFIIPWVIVHVRSDLTGGSSGIVVSSASIGDVVLKSQGEHVLSGDGCGRAHDLDGQEPGPHPHRPGLCGHSR